MKSSVGARLILVGLVVIGTFVYRAFFVDSDEVMNFNNRLVDFVEASDKRFVPIGGVIDQYAQGDEIDVEQMARFQSELADQTRRDKDTLAAMTVPDDDLCREFHRSCVEYVENSVQLAAKYATVVAYIREHNPAATDGDWAAVEGMLADLLAKDQALIQVVGDVQRRMAKKFDFQLK